MLKSLGHFSSLCAFSVGNFINLINLRIVKLCVCVCSHACLSISDLCPVGYLLLWGKPWPESLSLWIHHQKLVTIGCFLFVCLFHLLTSSVFPSPNYLILWEVRKLRFKNPYPLLLEMLLSTLKYSPWHFNSPSKQCPHPHAISDITMACSTSVFSTPEVWLVNSKQGFPFLCCL